VHGAIQGIRSTNFQGIGRAGIALEQIDYMADAFAVRALAKNELTNLGSAKRAREAGRIVSELVDATLSGIEAFDRMGGAVRITRLTERRLRRYLIWHLQRARAETIRGKSHLDDLLSVPLTVELAPLPGTLDSERLEKVVDGAYMETSLFCAVGGRLVRVDPAPLPGAADILEAVCTFNRATLTKVMSALVENNSRTLASWTERRST
jgi:hypothetical protein